MSANGKSKAPESDDRVEVVVEAALRNHLTRPGALLPIFHEIQDALGYVPPDSIGRIAHALNLSRAEVHGTLTFYHDFRTSPPGRHVVKLCRAEACQAMGCNRMIEEAHRRFGARFGETREDGALTMLPVYCLGNCALGPSAMVDGRLFGRVSVERLAAILPDVSVSA